MNNHFFIKHLDNLSKDRFALNALTHDEFTNFRQNLLASFGMTASPNNWYLIGTDGCHLCDNAKTLIAQAKLITNLPSVHELDLIDTDGALIDTLGVMIPVLITPSHLLCYPFGIMDILDLNIN